MTQADDMDTRPDQLGPGQHVKEMGGGWVILSAEFICAMAGVAPPVVPSREPLRAGRNDPSRAKRRPRR